MGTTSRPGPGANLDGRFSAWAEGWRPARETAFHQVAYMLILLEREATGSTGFGFTGT